MESRSGSAAAFKVCNRRPHPPNKRMQPTASRTRSLAFSELMPALAAADAQAVRPTAAWRWDMKAICLRARGGPEALAYEEAPQPHPGEGEVLVRVHAAGVIHTELSWVPTWTTQAGEPRPLPVIPGHEFSGEIAALGAGVRDVGVGNLVYGLNDWYRDGASAEYCVARVADIAHKPAGVDHVHAAATPISALTVWQGLIERAGLTAGQRVLIHGAAGGVGTFAVQLARIFGARVSCTASAANRALVRGLGADEVIDYRAERFEDVVRDVDVVFDT